MKKGHITWVATGLAVAGAFLYFQSCASIPKGVTAVTPFDADRYLGKWYEIARLDHRFERGLSQVTAEYSLNPDGSIKVLNKGYHDQKGKWEEAEGKAKFAETPNIARLKVSFFGPFYSGYNVIALDDDYQYALVVGNNTKYAWILSRETTIPDTIKEAYLKKAASIGVKTDELIWVSHAND